MKPSPVVSVIIPVYNTEKFLFEAIGSICNQSYHNLQILVIDDGSTDSSPEILRQFAAKDSRIEIITQPNQGQGAARNRGLEKARGEYVYFMDSDDILEPTCLEDCLRLCSTAGLDYVTFDASSFDENGDANNRFDYCRKGIIQEGCIWDSKELLLYSLNRNSFKGAVWMFFIKRSLMTDKSITFQKEAHEDNLCSFQLMLYANRCQYVAKSYFKRRLRPGSTMTSAFSLKDIYGYISIARKTIEMERAFPQWKELFELYLQKTLNSVVWLAHRLKPAEKAETLKLFFKHRLVKYASLRNWCVFFVKKD